MRIIGYLDFPGVKTTVFKMDNRLSVKFETGLYEQTYKFREGEGADTLEEVKKILHEHFFKSVMAQFQQMHALRNQVLSEAESAASEEAFEEIY
jgi:hypothetical protein